MIWESAYWKNDLIRLNKKITSRLKQVKWTDASNANCEKELMIAGFISRKLFDSKKISAELENYELQIVKFKSNGKRIHLLERLSPELYFDLDNPIKATIKFRTLCNQVIHSYIFILLRNEDRNFTHFWVASDFDKFKFMYQIDVKSYSSVLLEIGMYWPKHESYEFDSIKNDYIVKYD
jgi:hypothetical protein